MPRRPAPRHWLLQPASPTTSTCCLLLGPPLSCRLQVVADYRKARALLADQGAPGGGAATSGAGAQPQPQQQDGSMWAKLMDEIDKVGAGSGAGAALAARVCACPGFSRHQTQPGSPFSALM